MGRKLDSVIRLRLGWADPDKSPECFGFRIFSPAFDHAESEYVIYFYV